MERLQLYEQAKRSRSNTENSINTENIFSESENISNNNSNNNNNNSNNNNNNNNNNSSSNNNNINNIIIIIMLLWCCVVLCVRAWCACVCECV